MQRCECSVPRNLVQSFKFLISADFIFLVIVTCASCSSEVTTNHNFMFLCNYQFLVLKFIAHFSSLQISRSLSDAMCFILFRSRDSFSGHSTVTGVPFTCVF